MKWIKYLIYTVLIFAVFSYISFIDIRLEQEVLMTGIPGFRFWFIAIIDILLGLCLGIEHYIFQWRAYGRWIVNLPRLVCIGLPSLFSGFYFLIYYYYPNSPIGFITQYLPRFMIQSSVFMVFTQILIGYVIITSFYKTEHSKVYIH